MWATRANGVDVGILPTDAGQNVAELVDLDLQARLPQYALDNRSDAALPIGHRRLRRQPGEDV